MKTLGRLGFTLIELMIVVAIIGILAAIAIPKFAELVRKSREGSTKGNLGSIRSALTIYYGDNAGWFPSGSKQNPSTVLADTLVPKYLDRIPQSNAAGFHAATAGVRTHETPYTHSHDDGQWGYGSISNESGWGNLWIMCSHTDTKGSVWSDY